jgi:hypothetical protein
MRPFWVLGSEVQRFWVQRLKVKITLNGER